MELTVQFIEGKLKEAEKAIAIYTTLLEELNKARAGHKKTKTAASFLNLVVNLKETSDEKN
jgi:hypothetical protein